MSKTADKILTQTKAYCQEHDILCKGDKVLLAVSGGIDSVVLTHLLNQLDLKLGIAHCNFQLRGNDADSDEAFVKLLAERLELPYFSIQFDTKAYAKLHKLSIEMAARELRYEWLEQMRKQEGYHFIAIGHHKNDNTETLLLNLSKGTGMKGLHGILPKQGHVVRPLLCLTRDEIHEYAKGQKLQWREDASNAEDIYQRNLIRNQVIPILEEINPNVVNSLADSIERFSEAEELYKLGLERVLKKLVEQRKSGAYIPKKKLKLVPAPKTVLFEYLKEFGFNNNQVDDIYAVIDSTETKQFLTDTHRLIKDRDFLILTELATDTTGIAFIESPNKPVSNGAFQLKFHAGQQNKSPYTDKADVVHIDESKLEYPLILRPWKAGDYFYPLGMQKKKKVSRFLMDQKLNQLEKEQTLVLESRQKIVWVVGLRLDDRFRVTDQTKAVTQIKCNKKG